MSSNSLNDISVYCLPGLEMLCGDIDLIKEFWLLLALQNPLSI